MQIDLSDALRKAGLNAGHAATVIIVVVPSFPTSEPPSAVKRSWGTDSPQTELAASFFDDLMSGRIGDRSVSLPARSDDLYRWYELWCQRAGYWPLVQTRFVHAISQGGGVVVRRMRISSADDVKQPSIVLPADLPGRGRMNAASRAHLAQHLAGFRASFQRYADATSG